MFLSSIEEKRKEKKRKRKENGSWSRGRVRLSVQGCAYRGFGCWKIESSVPIHSERVLSGVEVDDWRGIRYSDSGGVFQIWYFCGVLIN